MNRKTWGLIGLCFVLSCAGGKQVRDLDQEELAHLEQLNLDLESGEGMNAMMGGAVQAVMLSHASEIDECYKKELKRKPKLEGNVTVNYVVQMNGKMTSFQIKKTTLNNEAVHSCIRKIFYKMDFPTSDKPMDVTYTFKFTKEKDDPPPPKELPVPYVPIVN